MLVAEPPVDRVRIRDERRRPRGRSRDRRGVTATGGHGHASKPSAGADRDDARHPVDGLVQRSCSALAAPLLRVARMCANGRPGGSTALRPDAIPGQLTVVDVRAAPGGGHMRIRSTGLTLFAGLSILVAACSSGDRLDRAVGSGSVDRADPRPRRRPQRRPAPSEAPSVKPTSDLKIGVVTDVGRSTTRTSTSSATRAPVQRRRSRSALRPRPSSSRRRRPTTSRICRRTSTRATTSS